MTKTFSNSRIHPWNITDWDKTWIASYEDIQKNTHNKIGLKDKGIIHVPIFEITTWGNDLYLKLIIGKYVFDDSKNISIDKIGIKATIVKFTNEERSFSVDFTNKNIDGLNLINFGFNSNINTFNYIDKEKKSIFIDTSNNIKYMIINLNILLFMW